MTAEKMLNYEKIFGDVQTEKMVVVGTWENPLKTTFWGEIATQLSRATGKPELYEIRLATIQPLDFENISNFNDALSKLKANLYYLYSQNTRLWFGTTPTLRKYFEDKREKFSDGDIIFEIETRLAKWRGKNNFNAVHICPKNSGEVTDEQTARLVIISPQYAFYERLEENPAFTFAKNLSVRNVP